MKTTLALFIAALLMLCAAQTPAQDLEWRKKVTDAKALDEPQRSEAMLALVREALQPREVRLAGTTHTDQVHPDDNEPAPIVNFDPRLNQKTSAEPRSGAATRSLQNNFGYYFSFQSKGYVVLGPAALDPRSPMFTRLAAEHELFHAENHVGDPRSHADRELETWTQMLVTFFADVHQFKQQWGPMFSYYEEATADAQKAAIDRLVAYHEAAGAEVRTAFDEWLARRKADKSSSKLVNDLENARLVMAEWGKRITAAKALQGEAEKREAMLALVREALPSHDVRVSGTKNEPAPVINFDERLEKSGNYFLSQGTPYVVLGPKALDPRSPVFTRMIAEHELFHARHHVGDPRPLNDRELETWTHVFVKYFHEVYPFKQRWAPLVSFYEEADPGERKVALDKLVAYHRAPPSAAVRVAFEEWLDRRRKDPKTSSSRLASDLDKATFVN
jgi:hypothetical protein